MNADVKVLECEPLTEAACLGYAIMALENLDYKDVRIWQVVAEMKELLDWVSTEEAEEHYNEGTF